MSIKVAIAMFFLAALGGCSFGLWRSPGATVEIFRVRAVTQENNGELQQALTDLRAASLLSPENTEIAERVWTLESAVAAAAQAHFKSGLEYHQAGDFMAARRELLTVLRISPGYQKALEYLKLHLNGVQPYLYKVLRGDSFVKIAAEHYKDPGKAYIIAYFNDMDPGKPLLTDTLLVLPDLRPEQLVVRRPADTLGERAQKALDQKQFTEVLAICEKMRQENPGHPRLQSLTDAARLGWGRSLLEQNEYLSALEQLKQVRPGVAGRDQALRKVQGAIQAALVQEKIKSAQARLDQAAYGDVVAICQEVLTQDPSNAKAKALIQAGRYQWGKQLLEQGDEEKAAENLRALDPDYQDAAHLLARAQARLNAHAEAHYRKGVKSFLNEDLESAIECWEKTLAFNPKHPKARHDMENALRLLDKWRGLDQATPAGK